MLNDRDGANRPNLVEGVILPTAKFDCSSWQEQIPPNNAASPFTVVHGNILDPIAEVGTSAPSRNRFAMLVHAHSIHDSFFRVAELLHQPCPEGWSVAYVNDTFSINADLLRLYDSFNGFDRAIGGAGWKLESTHRDNGTLTLTLAPVDPIGAAERVAKIVAAINQPGAFETPAALGKIEARIIEPGG
jgi:hypothetical protein